MKKKILLDMIMTAIMLCLLNTNLTGIKLHEILGIVAFVLFLVHKLLNFKWIKTVTLNLFKKKLTRRTRLLYAIDVTLLLLLILNVATGILISTHILPEFQANNIRLTSLLHHIFAYSLLAVLIAHIGLHWTFLTNATGIKPGSAAEKIVCCIATAVLVVILMSSNTISQLFTPHKAEDSHYQTEENSHEDDDDQDPPSVPNAPTLEEYLSKLICTGCEQRCLLTSPSCGRGRDQQELAVAQYNQTYQANETYSFGDPFPSSRPNGRRK